MNELCMSSGKYSTWLALDLSCSNMLVANEKLNTELCDLVNCDKTQAGI